ncbi:MAG: hypothetical protein ABSG26_03255 [Bryobacteraceae bacterium]|jgi:hypothetical protein
MNLNKMILVVLLAISLAGVATAAELSSADADKLLANMGYKNVHVILVVNGVGGLPNMMSALQSPNLAIVVAYGENAQGQPKDLKETVYYDKDLGWFYYELDAVNRQIRVWTTTGSKLASFQQSPSK